MANRTGLLTGVGMGIGLVYFLDPQRGAPVKTPFEISSCRNIDNQWRSYDADGVPNHGADRLQHVIGCGG
jgi:hypothetical protein